MNIIDIQDQLKNFSEDQLVNEMQMPSGNAPQFLVLSEIQRRKRVRDDFSKRQAAQQPTVAEEAIAAAGVPQSGIAGMSEAMAPKSTMVQNAVGSAMPEAMRSGGLMQFGNDIQKNISSQEVDPFLDEVEDMAESRFGVDFDNQSGGLRDNQPTQSPLGKFLGMPMINDPMPYMDAPFERESRRMPVKGGALPMPAVMPYEEGGLVGGLFSKTDRGKDISSRDYEIRIGKDGRRMVFKKGTNIFLGSAEKLFDEKYDGGLIRAQNGIPRGLRLNNPGNIRPGAGFYGEVGDDGGYAEFDSDEAGIRAIQRLLRTYGSKHGINTLRGLANRYAPPSDNNPTGNYIDFLSQQTGIDPDEPINLSERGAEIIPAIIGFEQGQQPFSQEMINRAIGAAQFDDEKKIAEALQANNSTQTASSTASDILKMLNPVSSAQASTLTSEPEKQPMPDIPQEIIRDGTGRPIGDASYGARIRAAMETGNEDIADRLVAQGVNEANFFERMMRNKDPDDLGSAATGMGIIDAPIGPGTLSPADITQVLPLDPTQNTARGTTVEEGVEEVVEAGPAPKGEPAETTPEPPKEPTSPKDPKASGLSSIEEEILALQKQMKKDRESDKWLAIAQAGLALMASDNPTLLGAAGEAGLEGLKAFRESNERYQEGVIDLLNARSKLAKSRTGLTQNQANQLAVDYEKIANDMSVDEQTRLRARILAEQLRMQGGLGMGLMAGNYDIATPSS